MPVRLAAVKSSDGDGAAAPSPSDDVTGGQSRIVASMGTRTPRSVATSAARE